MAAISFLLAIVSTGVSWLTLQPALTALLDMAMRADPLGGFALATRVKALLPFNLGLDLVVVSALTYLVVQYTVGRPLRQTELAIEKLSRLELDFASESGGPLLSRVQRALSRLAEALQQERVLTRRQLAELRGANDKLMRAQAELVASDRLVTLGKLAAGVAHEVGNPLSGILGYLSVLRSRARGAGEQLEIVGAIEAEVQRIDQIVRSLLDLGRPGKGKPGPVDLVGVVRAATRLLSNSPEFVKVEVAVDAPAELFVVAEPGSLSQVVINLVLNAAQAMGGQGRIALKVAPQGADVALTVADSGPGLTAEAAAHLFEPFFTTKAAGKGTGLGLAVCLHLVTTLGGKISGGNAPTGGALFTVLLPAA